MDQSAHRTQPVFGARIKKKKNKSHRGHKHKKRLPPYSIHTTTPSTKHTTPPSSPATLAQQLLLNQYSVKKPSLVTPAPEQNSQEEHTPRENKCKNAICQSSTNTPLAPAIKTQQRKLDEPNSVKLAIPMANVVDSGIDTRAALSMLEKQAFADPEKTTIAFFEDVQRANTVAIDYVIVLSSVEFKNAIKNILTRKGAYDKYGQPTEKSRSCYLALQAEYVATILDQKGKTICWKGVNLEKHYPTGATVYKHTPREWSGVHVQQLRPDSRFLCFPGHILRMAKRNYVAKKLRDSKCKAKASVDKAMDAMCIEGSVTLRDILVARSKGKVSNHISHRFTRRCLTIFLTD